MSVNGSNFILKNKLEELDSVFGSFFGKEMKQNEEGSTV